MISDLPDPCHIGQGYVIQLFCTFSRPKYVSDMLSFLGDKYCQIILIKIGMRNGKNVLHYEMSIMICVQG